MQNKDFGQYPAILISSLVNNAYKFIGYCRHVVDQLM